MSSGPLGVLPASGDRLGAYEILGEIAHGGMAAVYLARRRFEVGGLGKLVAIKVLLPHLRSREFVDMFLDEARVAIAIAHSNVVQVLDVGEDAGCPYLVMEYLRGQPFGRVVRRAREAGAPVDGMIYLALAQAAAGLHAAHETRGADGQPLGVVHRDVAPGNIHVGYDGCTKLVDFGLAASRGKLVQTRPNMVKGTLSYLAPEQISRAHPVDRRTDLWAFGVVAWEALVGAPLFSGDSEAVTLWNVMEREVPDPRARATAATGTPGIPDGVAASILACLQRDPQRRPRDLRALELALVHAAQLVGMATPRELGAAVSELFASERQREAEQTDATARRAGASTRRETEAEPTVPRGPAPGAKRPLVAGILVAVIAAAAALTLALVREPGPTTSERSATRLTTEPAPSPASRVAPRSSASSMQSASPAPSTPPAPPAPSAPSAPSPTASPALRGAAPQGKPAPSASPLRARPHAVAATSTPPVRAAPPTPASPTGAATSTAPTAPVPAAPAPGPLLENPYR